MENYLTISLFINILLILSSPLFYWWAIDRYKEKENINKKKQQQRYEFLDLKLKVDCMQDSIDELNRKLNRK